MIIGTPNRLWPGAASGKRCRITVPPRATASCTASEPTTPAAPSSWGEAGDALTDLVDPGGRRSPSPVRSHKQDFGHLSDSLKTLLSHSAVQLELDPPANDGSLTSATAHAVRVSVRAAVLAVLQQSEVRRIRVGWQLGLTELVATVRDDGPGVLRDDLRAGQIAQRVEAQGGAPSNWMPYPAGG